MKKIYITLLFFLFPCITEADEITLWSADYQNVLMEKIGQVIKHFCTYPAIAYPNIDAQQIIDKYPEGKVLLFGYGSLINAESAACSMSSEAVQTMRPVLAFGVKRLFNYKANNVSKWGTNLPENERAMLNIEPTTTFAHMINGVVLEIDPKDLYRLVLRETGYDLVPLLVADWKDVTSENPLVSIEIAYTFLVPDELRNGVDYTQTRYYPVRGYLQAVRRGAFAFGSDFLNFWNATTYLADGTTSVTQWNEQTFSGILDTKEP